MTRSSLAVLAHELRSPVAALVVIAGAYAEADETTRARLRALALDAATSIERLLGDPALTTYRFERVDLGEIATAAATAAAIGGGVVEVMSADTVIVEGDPARLRQAIDNLIENALGHSPPGVGVVVETHRASANAFVVVTDEGEGIASVDLERIFESGVRLTTRRPGSGLGLAVAREIARAHEGEVEVESVVGHGSSFRLVLPVASGED